MQVTVAELYFIKVIRCKRLTHSFLVWAIGEQLHQCDERGVK